MIQVDVQRLPEGVYLATSNDVPGLIVEADTKDEVRRIVPDITAELFDIDGRKLREEQFAYTWRD